MMRNKDAIAGFLTFIVLVSGCAMTFAAPTLEQRKAAISARDNSISEEATRRKARSEAILRQENVRIHQQLPVIETEKEAQKRTTNEIAYRTLSLLAVALKGEGLEKDIVDRVVNDYGLQPYLTPKESVFVRDTIPSQSDRIQFSWRYESVWVLLWALGYVEELKTPTEMCDVQRMVSIIKARSEKQFIADAKLRPLSQILDQADLIYRYHWAVVEARVNGGAAPSGVSSDIVQERHHALNWLIGYMGQAWDDVTTDT